MVNCFSNFFFVNTVVFLVSIFGVFLCTVSYMTFRLLHQIIYKKKQSSSQLDYIKAVDSRTEFQKLANYNKEQFLKDGSRRKICPRRLIKVPLSVLELQDRRLAVKQNQCYPLAWRICTDNFRFTYHFAKNVSKVDSHLKQLVIFQVPFDYHLFIYDIDNKLT